LHASSSQSQIDKGNKIHTDNLPLPTAGPTPQGIL
jgi:hypothetical protein